MYRESAVCETAITFESSVSRPIRNGLVLAVALSTLASTVVVAGVCQSWLFGVLLGSVVVAPLTFGVYRIASRRRCVATIYPDADSLVVAAARMGGEPVTIRGDTLVSASEWQLVLGRVVIERTVRVEIVGEGPLSRHSVDIPLGGSGREADRLLAMIRMRLASGRSGSKRWVEGPDQEAT